MRRVLTGMGLTLLLTAAAPASPVKEKACYIDDFETPIRCVTISVPMDYDAPADGSIEVTAAVVPATTARPAPDPLFVFAGGPGQAATALGPWVNTAFAPARRERDIILFDIRGVGMSSPIDCPLTMSGTQDAVTTFRSDAAACAAKAGKRARFLSSRELVEDIERMRLALGLKQINLWGGSFGTRISQHYARAYGSNVRAVVMDAASPVGNSIFLTAPRYGEEALQRLVADCRADPGCAKAFPNLKQDLDTVLNQLGSAPLTMSAIDPRTGTPDTVRLDADVVAGAVRSAMYGGLGWSLVPFAISQAARGNHAPLLALGSGAADVVADGISIGSMLGVLCGEDVELARRAEPAARSFGFMRDSYYRSFAAGCEAWPHRALPEAMLKPFTSKIPVLAISGVRDPVTPPDAADEALKMFGRHVHIRIDAGFHTNSNSRCISERIAEFLKNPQQQLTGLDCVNRFPRPRFMLSPTL
jgi:pimeloyl-ACP methyl ester carboxylesterase